MKAQELNLSSKLIWTEEEIKKSPINLKLFAIDLSGYAVKRRCRKVDHYYSRLCFLDPKPLTEIDLEVIKGIARQHIEMNIKENKGLRIIIKDTEFQAPRPDSPMFYGFKEMLMGDNRKVIEL